MFDLYSIGEVADKHTDPPIFQPKQQNQETKGKMKSISLSQQVTSYKNHMDDCQEYAKNTIQAIPAKQLNHHNIRILNSQYIQESLTSFKEPTITIQQLERKGSIVVYNVIIGVFALLVKILHVNHPRDIQSEKLIGMGTFGEVYQLNVNGKTFVTKVTKFDQIETILNEELDGVLWITTEKARHIRQLLIEFSIGKICSLFGIGPRIITDLGFDILCWSTHVQFYMEKCFPYPYRPADFDMLRMVHRLKSCVRILHLLHFVHRDIKRQNLLYSPSVQDFVLSDFGTTMIVQEDIHQKTMCYRAGTEEYMNEEMKQLHPQKIGFINLYHNDLHGLLITIELMIVYRQKKLIYATERKENEYIGIFENVIKIYERRKYDSFMNIKEGSILSKLLPYFPELLQSWKPTSEYFKYDVEMLMRSTNFLTDVLIYLPDCDQQNDKVRGLWRKLHRYGASGLRLENCEVVQRLLGIQNFKKARLIMLSQLQKIEHRKQKMACENAAKTLELLIGLFHLELNFTHQRQQCEYYLQRLIALRNKYIWSDPNLKKRVQACQVKFNLSFHFRQQSQFTHEYIVNFVTDLHEELCFQLAQALLNQRRFSTVKSILEKISHPNNQWLRLMFQVYYNTEGIDNAMKFLDDVDSLPDCRWDTQPLLKAAIVAKKSKCYCRTNPLKAVALCLQASSEAPIFAQRVILEVLAKTYFSLCDYEKAYSTYCKCIELVRITEGFTKVYHHLQVLALESLRLHGGVQVAYGQLLRQVDYLKHKVLDGDQTLIKAYKQLTICSIIVGSFEKALQYGNLVVEQSKNSPLRACQAWRIIGRIYHQMIKQNYLNQQKVSNLADVAHRRMSSFMDVVQKQLPQNKWSAYWNCICYRVYFLFRLKRNEQAYLLLKRIPLEELVEEYSIYTFAAHLLIDVNLALNNKQEVHDIILKVSQTPIPNCFNNVTQQLNLIFKLNLIMLSQLKLQRFEHITKIMNTLLPLMDYRNNYTLSQLNKLGTVFFQAEFYVIASRLFSVGGMPRSIQSKVLYARCLLLLPQNPRAKQIIQQISHQLEDKSNEELVLCDISIELRLLMGSHLRRGLDPHTYLMHRLEYLQSQLSTEGAARELAICYVELGENNKAATLFTRELALVIKKGVGKQMVDLAKYLGQLGLYKQCIACIKRFLSFSFAGNIIGLGSILAIGKTRQFYKTLRRITLTSEKGADSLREIKELVFEAGNLTKSLVIIGKARESASSDTVKYVQDVIEGKFSEISQANIKEKLWKIQVYKQIRRECGMYFRGIHKRTQNTKTALVKLMRQF